MISKFFLHWREKQETVNIQQADAATLAMVIEGQVSKAEVIQLVELARTSPANTSIVEIGSYRGRSTIALALGSLSSSKNRVYAIDPHVEFTGVFGGHFGPEDQALLYKNIVRANVGEIVSVVSLSSQAASKAWSSRTVSLLWLDGDHSYSAVRDDYDAWSPFLISDAVIAFHDSEAHGVTQVINELLQAQRIEPMGRVDSLSWFRHVDEH
jgi:predicted O-methyltransferase YrrM